MTYLEDGADHSPEDASGPVVGSQLVLGRSDQAVILLHVLLAYPSGIKAYLGVHLRAPMVDRTWLEELRDSDRPGGLRLGFTYTVPAELRPLRSSFGTIRPIWGLEGSDGTELSHRGWLWISPYPPSGLLVLAAAWPDQGIAATSTKMTVPIPAEIERQTMWLWG
jgi:hypothetical protein